MIYDGMVVVLWEYECPWEAHLRHTGFLHQAAEPPRLVKLHAPEKYIPNNGTVDPMADVAIQALNDPHARTPT